MEPAARHMATVCAPVSKDPAATWTASVAMALLSAGRVSVNPGSVKICKSLPSEAPETLRFPG